MRGSRPPPTRSTRRRAIETPASAGDRRLALRRTAAPPAASTDERALSAGGGAAGEPPPSPLLTAAASGDAAAAVALAHSTDSAEAAAALVAAARLGRAEVVTALHAAGVGGAASGGGALHAASLHGHAAAVEALLAAGFEGVDAVDAEGRTPLWLASQQGHEGVVDRLLAAGAAVGAASSAGESALLVATLGGHEAAVQTLLEASASAEAADKAGWRPLLRACQRGHEGIVRMLLEVGVDLQATTLRDGLTALHVACRDGHTSVARALLSAGAALEQSDPCKLPRKMEAAVSGVQAGQNVLVEGRVEEVMNISGEALIHIAGNALTGGRAKKIWQPISSLVVASDAAAAIAAERPEATSQTRDNLVKQDKDKIPTSALATTDIQAQLEQMCQSTKLLLVDEVDPTATAIVAYSSSRAAVSAATVTGKNIVNTFALIQRIIETEEALVRSHERVEFLIAEKAASFDEEMEQTLQKEMTKVESEMQTYASKYLVECKTPYFPMDNEAMEFESKYGGLVSRFQELGTMLSMSSELVKKKAELKEVMDKCNDDLAIALAKSVELMRSTVEDYSIKLTTSTTMKMTAIEALEQQKLAVISECDGVMAAAQPKLAPIYLELKSATEMLNAYKYDTEVGETSLRHLYDLSHPPGASLSRDCSAWGYAPVSCRTFSRPSCGSVGHRHALRRTAAPPAPAAGAAACGHALRRRSPAGAGVSIARRRVDARQQAAADAIHTAARDRDARVGRRSTPRSAASEGRNATPPPRRLTRGAAQADPALAEPRIAPRVETILLPAGWEMVASGEGDSSAVVFLGPGGAMALSRAEAWKVAEAQEGVRLEPPCEPPHA
jgi:hypothetical protein